LLQDFIGRDKEGKNKLFLFGDQYQKIYEFIGALEGIINKACFQYSPRVISLGTNHRFKKNVKILTFDENIRRIAANPKSPCLDKNATIDVIKATDQNDEGIKDCRTDKQNNISRSMLYYSNPN
jgi:superfamily I DNA/RNA helicase